MHLAFIDIAYGYKADRPDTDEPLGGTTSAICFLARELVKAGVSCSFFNKIKESQTAHGIPAHPLDQLMPALASTPFTAVIFCGRWIEGMVQLIHEATSAPLIAWMHESTFNPQLVPALDIFDAIAFVSEWQKRVNQVYVKPHWKQVVLRNAMNPKAATLFSDAGSILEAKTKPPVLLYAGSFARGAFHLPKILDFLQPKHQDFTLEIFSNTDPSKDPAKDALYIDWLRKRPHITHVGMVGQNTLLDRMKRATLLLAPNPWPETSCITLIEAMASGLDALTTNRAALPETGHGFNRMIPIEDPDHLLRFDMPIDLEAFANLADATLTEWQEKPALVEARLRTQVQYFHDHYQWKNRVQPWVQFIESLA
jgi:glycosyltransferase involved in cell wall biosynthesis